MPKRVIRRFDDVDKVSRAAADEFVRCCQEACQERGRFLVAMAGGSTPKLLYQLLAGQPYRERIDWARVEFFWGDERAVPPEHADSNYGMASKALLQKVPLQPAQVHRMAAESADLEAAAHAYQKELARVANVSPDGSPSALDLVLLGMGPDGHTASLFPGTTALKEKSRWVVPNFVPKFSANRLTLTATILNQARQVLFLVAGADKAPNLAAVLEGPQDTDRLPSQLIQPIAGNLTWFVDTAAAAQLKATT